MEIFDVNKICRICLEENELISLFELSMETPPFQMIMNVANILIFENDGFPEGICNNCIYRVQIAFDLKNQCVNSNFKLQQILIPIPENDSLKPINDSQFMIVNLGNNNPEVTEPNISTKEDNVIISAMNEILAESIVHPKTDPLTSPHSTVDEHFYDHFDLMPADDYDHIEEISSEPQPINQIELVPVEEIKTEGKPSQTEACQICGKTFSYNGYLKTHLRVHSGIKPFKCPYTFCNSQFAQAGNLQLHIKIHIGEKVYQCEICSKMCVSLSNLTSHRKIHTERRDFKCHLCPKAFKVKQDLTNHVGTHSGIKNYRCKICDKSFYKVAYMNIHVKNVHEKEKRYSCKDCGKEFNNTSNLNCHVRIHTGERPYICKFASCNAKFNQSSSLVRHRKQHLVNPKLIEKKIEETVILPSLIKETTVVNQFDKVENETKFAVMNLEKISENTQLPERITIQQEGRIGSLDCYIGRQIRTST